MGQGNRYLCVKSFGIYHHYVFMHVGDRSLFMHRLAIVEVERCKLCSLKPVFYAFPVSLPHLARTPTQCTVIIQNPEKGSLRASSSRTHAAASATGGKLDKRGPATAAAQDGPAAAIDSDDEVFVHEFTVTVKYVRREIRDLTDRDREMFFNAVSVLQRVPSAAGRAIYGNKYYSKDYFNRIHLYYGEQRMFDLVCGLGGTITWFPYPFS